MALIEEFEKAGHWLFRWRSYLPLLLLSVFLLAMKNFEYMGHDHRLDQLWELVCLAVSFFGLSLRAITIGYAPSGTSGRRTKRQKAEILNKTGMYSIVRNPLYLGNFFIWLGISMFFHLWWVSLICILIFWLYYERIIFAEEAFLRKKFGIEFEEWARHTPAFWPRVKTYTKPDVPFSFKKVLGKEYTGFFGIIATMTCLEIVGDVIVEGKLMLDFMWMVLFSIGLSVYVIVRVFKKKTQILSVKKRRHLKDS